MLERKSAQIRGLQYDLAKVSKAHNDLIRVRFPYPCVVCLMHQEQQVNCPRCCIAVPLHKRRG